MSDELTKDDYAALHQMLLSPDESIRMQGQAVAKKLTPAESQQFFDFQNEANKGKGELSREDASVGGMPPELAVVGGVGTAAALARGTFLRHVVAPTVAGEGTRRGLKAVGLPHPIPEIGGAAAAILTGRALSPSAPSAAAEAEPATAEAVTEGPQRPIIMRGPKGEPIAIDPATPAGLETTRAARGAFRKGVPAAPEAPPAATPALVEAPAAPALSPARVANDVALAARRAGFKLTAAQDAVAQKIVAAGGKPTEAVLVAKLGTPLNDEMLADFGRRARAGQKTLMPLYGNK
jgi:hypothetical protein